MHGCAWIEQYTFSGGLVVPVDGIVLPNEIVILSYDLARGRVGEARVKSHRGPAIGDQFGNGCASAGALVFAQREGLATGGTADVARMQSAFAEVAVFQVRVHCGIAGTVPEIILILRPQLRRQQAALVGIDLAEAADMVPLADDKAGFQ